VSDAVQKLVGLGLVQQLPNGLYQVGLGGWVEATREMFVCASFED
jgi:hypothetical protein